MTVRLHPHARERLAERGATEREVIAAVGTANVLLPSSAESASEGTSFVGMWRGRPYTTKQVEVYAVEEGDAWLVITVVVKYFGERETR